MLKFGEVRGISLVLFFGKCGLHFVLKFFGAQLMLSKQILASGKVLRSRSLGIVAEFGEISGFLL